MRPLSGRYIEDIRTRKRLCRRREHIASCALCGRPRNKLQAYCSTTCIERARQAEAART